ncbi:uncharacterized protein [Amphiura filiformis]|uniref:uncharacterized protein isoform X1 n=1 Tax=Amphiura filiformis TaxID=82378 RepID=UPI003B2188C5
MADKGDNGYVLHIFTGGKLTAGTDANVLITLYGEKGESGETKLDNVENNFERNKEDIFNIKAKDLGKLSKIKIGHDNTGGGPAWFLDKVLVEDAEDGATYEFACDRWFADDEDDNQIVRELECTKSTEPTKKKKKKADPKGSPKKTPAKGQAKGQTKGQAKGDGTKGGKKEKSKDEGDNGYVLHIFTGGKLTAGTDANVIITLYGEKGESGETKLDNVENNFERNKEDVFNIKAKDLGKLSKIKIGHDNSGAGPAWFLDKVVVDNEEDGATFTFACDRWFADDEDDNQIVRELECTESTEPTKQKAAKADDEEEGAGADEEEGSETAEETAEEKRKRQFEAEFTRLKQSLEKESTRIVKPEFKPYSPFIFSSLEPYYNTYAVEFILDYPDHVKHGFITRKTAIGMVDPEVSHRMDVDLDDVPPSTPRSPRVENPEPKMTQDGNEKEGSTRLPKWPIVEIVKSGPMTKERLNWADVPKLREELRTKYSSNAQERRKKDYQRTKQDWTRMELQKLKEIHEVNRSHMQVTCTTYLGTSTGGKAAVKSLAKVLE